MRPISPARICKGKDKNGSHRVHGGHREGFWFYFFRFLKKIKPTLCSFPSLSVNSVRDNPASAAFSLIEILVALIIVTVTVSVVLGSQLHSLKIEQKARAFQIFRFETQRIFSATHRAENEAQLIELLSTGGLCRVKSEPVKIESGTNVLTLVKHELSADPSAIASATAEALPSFSSVFYTRIPDYTGRRPDTTDISGSRQKE